jgi:hypothetical protein
MFYKYLLLVSERLSYVWNVAACVACGYYQLHQFLQ